MVGRHFENAGVVVEARVALDLDDRMRDAARQRLTICRDSTCSPIRSSVRTLSIGSRGTIWPLIYNGPLIIWMRSPGRPMTRLMCPATCRAAV